MHRLTSFGVHDIWGDHDNFCAACRVLEPGNPQLRGSLPSNLTFSVLRYQGGSNYLICSRLPCTGGANDLIFRLLAPHPWALEVRLHGIKLSVDPSTIHHGRNT